MTAAAHATPIPQAPHSRVRPPKSFLGVTIPSDLAAALAAHCAHSRVSKSLYVEVALRRALLADTTPAPSPQETP